MCRAGTVADPFWNTAIKPRSYNNLRLILPFSAATFRDTDQLRNRAQCLDAKPFSPVKFAPFSRCALPAVLFRDRFLPLLDEPEEPVSTSGSRLSRGASMRRIVLFVGLLLGIVLSSAHPQGQRRPTISEDLKAALASGARVRVIVQAEEDALSSLRFRLGRGLRRQSRRRPLARCHARATCSRLAAEGGVAHLSGDLAGRRRHGHHQQGHARRQGVGRVSAACLASCRSRRSRAAASASPSSTRASPSTTRSPGASSRA